MRARDTRENRYRPFTEIASIGHPRPTACPNVNTNWAISDRKREVKVIIVSIRSVSGIRAAVEIGSQRELQPLDNKLKILRKENKSLTHVKTPLTIQNHPTSSIGKDKMLIYQSIARALMDTKSTTIIFTPHRPRLHPRRHPQLQPRVHHSSRSQAPPRHHPC